MASSSRACDQWSIIISCKAPGNAIRHHSSCAVLLQLNRSSHSPPRSTSKSQTLSMKRPLRRGGKQKLFRSTDLRPSTHDHPWTITRLRVFLSDCGHVPALDWLRSYGIGNVLPLAGSPHFFYAFSRRRASVYAVWLKKRPSLYIALLSCISSFKSR
jgi:hypothetical protein